MNFQRNNLDKETSPYLLQHKDNPVWWQPWNKEVLEYAAKNNKPLLISIGYAACHWCHVMEHECFEDEEVARLMNAHFVCIKIDREERPDVDTVYMNAVQLLTGSGGWPLNVFALPNQKPFYGGTYFPKDKWKHLLQTIAEKYQTEKNQLEHYATDLQNGLSHMEWIDMEQKNSDLSKTWLKELIEKWSGYFDKNWGGSGQAPKFPLPGAWGFLLRYGFQTKNIPVLNQVELTLDRMAWGGIFDVVSGGFSRYSVDPYWKVPHFEKMLYDNGQLLSLYGNAYKAFHKPEYKQVFKKIVNWLKEDMLSPSGLFYASYDADSEGEEGKYYTWKIEELKTILCENYAYFETYFNVGNFGAWEEQNILIQLEKTELIAGKLNIDRLELEKIIGKCLKLLKTERDKRVKPNLDDKCLTSWNALTISGLLTLAKEDDLQEKLMTLSKNALDFLLTKQWQEQTVYRNYKDGISSIPGFLDDYAYLLKALIDYYEVSFEKSYLWKAKELLGLIQFKFYHPKMQLFQYTSLSETPLIIDTFPIHDSVEPSGNSIMAENLFRLGKLFSEDKLMTQAENMLHIISPKIKDYPQNYANWLNVAMDYIFPYYEIVIMGGKANQLNAETKSYIPNAVLAGSKNEIYLEIMENRLVENETLIYICKDKSCSLPSIYPPKGEELNF